MSVFRVTNQTELKAALGKAVGGDTISLAGGNYGDVSLIHGLGGADLDFDSKVTIRSEDLENPAVLTGLNLSGARNLTFDGLIFDYVFKSGDSVDAMPFVISNSHGIAIRNSIFDGDVARGVSNVEDGRGFGRGLVVLGGSSGVSVTGSEFYNFHRAALFVESSKILLQGNDVHDIRSDGFNFAAVTNVLIENNHLHDFRSATGSGDHPDMIQFWTAGTTTPTTDIVIRGNILDIGKGSYSQSIFMGNEAVAQGAGAGMFYQNVLIENNIIQNNHLHGITVGGANGLIIRSNTLLYKAGIDPLEGTVGVPQIYVSSTSKGVNIEKNIVSAIDGYAGQSDWSLGRNALVQHTNPNAPNWYGDVFVSSTFAETSGPVLLPGSALSMLGAGAAQTRGLDLAGLMGRIHVTDFSEDAALRIFDARFSAADGRDLPAGTVYMWSFEDDSQYMGPVIGYRFAEGGIFSVRLTVMTPDGRTDSVDYTIDVAGPEVLSYAAGGRFTAFDNGDAIALVGGAALSADGLALGGAGTVYTVGKEHVGDIPGTDELAVDFSIRAASTASAGEIFRLHQSFAVGVQADGDLSVELLTADGARTVLESSGARLNDRSEHDVSIRIADGQVKIFIDDALAGSTKITGVLAGPGYNDLIFGNPWGAANFDGLMTRFSMDRDSSDFTDAGEGRGYAVMAETSSDWSMLCTPTQTDEAGTVAFDTYSGSWVTASGTEDLIPMI